MLTESEISRIKNVLYNDLLTSIDTVMGDMTKYGLEFIQDEKNNAILYDPLLVAMAVLCQIKSGTKESLMCYETHSTYLELFDKQFASILTYLYNIGTKTNRHNWYENKTIFLLYLIIDVYMMQQKMSPMLEQIKLAKPDIVNLRPIVMDHKTRQGARVIVLADSSTDPDWRIPQDLVFDKYSKSGLHIYHIPNPFSNICVNTWEETQSYLPLTDDEWDTVYEAADSSSKSSKHIDEEERRKRFTVIK